MSSVTLEVIIQNIRARSEYTDNFISDTDMTLFINNSIAKVSDIARLFDTSRFVSTVDITTVNGTESYTVTGALDIIDVEFDDRILKRVNWNDRLKVDDDTYGLNWYDETYYYNYRGTKLYLFPVPTNSVDVITVKFTPETTALVAEGSWSAPITWQEWVYCDVLCKCAAKAEDSDKAWRAEQQQLEAIIRASSTDIGSVPTIGSKRRSRYLRD